MMLHLNVAVNCCVTLISDASARPPAPIMARGLSPRNHSGLIRVLTRCNIGRRVRVHVRPLESMVYPHEGEVLLCAK